MIYSPNQIPRWERGDEWAKMIMPRNKTLNILGLGASVGTASEGITAEVLVVSSFEELHNKSALVYKYNTYETRTPFITSIMWNPC